MPPLKPRGTSRKIQIEQEIAQVVEPGSAQGALAKPVWRTRAPFLINHKWQWVTWNHHHGNRHAAILEKAKELGATMWDFGQADHGEFGRVNF